MTRGRAATIPDVATLYVRNMAPEVVARIRRRAAARGLKVEDYIARLVDLHGLMLEITTHEGPGSVVVARLLDGTDLGRVLD